MKSVVAAVSALLLSASAGANAIPVEPAPLAAASGTGALLAFPERAMLQAAPWNDANDTANEARARSLRGAMNIRPVAHLYALAGGLDASLIAAPTRVSMLDAREPEQPRMSFANTIGLSEMNSLPDLTSIFLLILSIAAIVKWRTKED